MMGVDEDCEKRKQEKKNRKKETGKKGQDEDKTSKQKNINWRRGNGK